MLARPVIFAMHYWFYNNTFTIKMRHAHYRFVKVPSFWYFWVSVAGPRPEVCNRNVQQRYSHLSSMQYCSSNVQQWYSHLSSWICCLICYYDTQHASFMTGVYFHLCVRTKTLGNRSSSSPYTPIKHSMTAHSIKGNCQHLFTEFRTFAPFSSRYIADIHAWTFA